MHYLGISTSLSLSLFPILLSMHTHGPSEIEATCDKWHGLQVYHLVTFELCKHSRNHHYNRENERIYHLHKLPHACS